MNNQNPLQPEFWRQFALSNLKDRVNEKCMRPETWDKAASTYDDLEKCKDYQEQVNVILNILQQKGALDKGNVAIDIACGTGAYTVRFAPFVKKIVALDISSGMLKRLKEKIERFNLNNIKIIQADWRQYFKEDQFDLVFCSMTPLLRDPDTIDRFLRLSKRFVGVVTWAGVRKNALLNEVSEKVLGRPFKQKGQDINFIFNYLYTLGHAPHLTFFSGCWERVRPLEQQVENLIWRLQMKRPLKEDEKTLIREIVAKYADKDGMVRAVSTVRTCFMFIDKFQSKGNFEC